MMTTRIITLKQNLDSLFAAIVGAYIIYKFTSLNGIGVSPDSIAYISVARNMQTGRFWYQFDHLPLILFPFFYPSFLGSIMFVVRDDILKFAPILNAALFGMIIFLSGCILQRFRYTTKIYKWLLLSCMVLSSSLLEIYSMLWSETLFIFELVLFMIALQQYSKNYSLKSLIIIGSIASIACVTRFAGVTFIGIGSLLLFLDNKLKWQKKWWHILLFGVISLVLLAINLLKNYLVKGTLTGERQQGITPLADNLQYYGNVMWDWLKLPIGDYRYASVLGVLLVLVFTVVIIKRYWQQKDIFSFENIAAIAFIVYVAFIVITATISRYERINNRLLSPAFIPLLFGLTFWIPSFTNIPKQKEIGFALIVMCIMIFSLFQYKQYKWCTDWYEIIASDGIPGYTESAWKRSDIIHFLHEENTTLKKGIKITSNANDAVYFFTGLPCEIIPETVHQKEVKNYYKKPPHYIIWFINEFDSPDVLRLETIAINRHLDTLKTFKDGYLIWCSYK